MINVFRYKTKIRKKSKFELDFHYHEIIVVRGPSLKTIQTNNITVYCKQPS